MSQNARASPNTRFSPSRSIVICKNQHKAPAYGSSRIIGSLHLEDTEPMNEHKDERQGVSTDPAQCAHNVQAGCPADSGGASLRELVIRRLTQDNLRLTISIPEAAKLLGISKDLAYQLSNRSDFPSLQLGGRRVINLIGLLDWLDSQTVTDRKECG